MARRIRVVYCFCERHRTSRKSKVCVLLLVFVNGKGAGSETLETCADDFLTATRGALQAPIFFVISIFRKRESSHFYLCRSADHCCLSSQLARS